MNVKSTAIFLVIAANAFPTAIHAQQHLEVCQNIRNGIEMAGRAKAQLAAIADNPAHIRPGVSVTRPGSVLVGELQGYKFRLRQAPIRGADCVYSFVLQPGIRCQIPGSSDAELERLRASIETCMASNGWRILGSRLYRSTYEWRESTVRNGERVRELVGGVKIEANSLNTSLEITFTGNGNYFQ